MIVLSLDLAPFEPELVDHRLHVGAAPNWLLWTFGTTNALGEAALSLALPNAPALVYRELYASGLVASASPWRTTTPIGGIVR